MEFEKAEVPDIVEEMRPHPIDPEYNSPNQGGCWICCRGNGYENNPPEWEFSTEFDTFYHRECLEKVGIDPDSDRPILKFERGEFDV